MSNKYNSDKRISNPNRKFHSGDEIINKLENLYHQSLRTIKYSSQMDLNEKIFDKIIPLNKQFTSLEKKSFSNRYINPNKKSLYRYGSIDSIIKKNPQQSLSNDPPTVDMSGKNLSPRNGNIKSNIFDSSSKYKLKSELKVVSEIKDSKNKKEYKIKNLNEDEVNYKDISLYSNKSDINNQNYSSNKDYNDENQKDILLKSDENTQKNNKKKEKIKLNRSISESSLGSFKPDKKEFPRFQKDYYSLC